MLKYLTLAFGIITTRFLLALYFPFVIRKIFDYIEFTEKYDTGIAPTFVVPIKPKAAKPTETVELSCVVSGTPVPTIVWCRGDEQVVPDDSHVISYTPETGESKLTICNATELDVNDYTVKAVNDFGMAQCRANLIIGNNLFFTL